MLDGAALWGGARAARVCALASTGLGALVLGAFWLGLPLQSWLFPGSVLMRPSTALCFALLGTALLGVSRGLQNVRHAPIWRACSAVVVVVTLLCLLQLHLPFELGIEGLLVGELPPGRMSPLTAGVQLFIALALSLSSAGIRETRAYHGLLAAAGLLTLLPIVGYLYRAPLFYQVGQPGAIAVSTVLGLVVLTFGCVAARVDEGLWPLLVGATPGSLLMRRGLPAVFGLPVLFGLVRLEVSRHAPVDTAVGAGVTATLTVVTLMGLLLWAATRLRAQDLERQVAVASLQNARNTLEERVEERTRVLKQTDVELRRAASQLLVAKEAAEAAMRARADFLARMSHEMRTPLNGVVGMLEIALRSELSPAQRDYVLTARTSAEALLALINDILDFSKIDAGKLSLSSMPFRLRDCIGTALRESAHTAHQKGLELFMSPAADAPDCLIGDPQRLRQVISNLVSNAVKFTTQGEVRVEVSADSRAQGSVELVITVSDTGVGIARDKQAEIFQAFAQADESTTRRFGGTGLGLAVSAQLVQLMGGQIGVDSAEGRGSRFFFALTLAVDEEAELTRSSQPRPFAGRTVLLIEPHQAHRELVSEQLRDAGLEPVVCTAGELLSRLEPQSEGQAPALLIAADDAVSEHAGLLAALRRRMGQSWPVLLLTRATAPDAERQERLLLASAQLTKPVVPCDLLETIHGLLSESKLEPEHAQLSSDAKPLNVLLAEDNEVNRRVACFLLEDAGYNVVAVQNGHQALAALWERNFDVVLMDGHMPEMDGIEATRQFRERERQQGTAHRTPIVALTAQAMKGDRERYLAAGMDAYLTKPFQAAQLLSILREVVGRSPPVSPRTERQSRQRGGSRPTETPLLPPPHARPSLAQAAPTQVAQSAAPVAPPIAARPPSLGPLTVYQRSQLLDRLRGQEHVLRTMVGIFDEEVGDMLGTLRRHIDERDVPGVERSAHKLAGALLTVGGQLAATTARMLEAAARERDLGDAHDLHDTLRDQLASLRQAFLLAGDLPEASRSA